ncbi:cell wall biosynthesis glycosyltransferase [Candidatus Campbellbacteria bacterium CG22_combo_CG10-13_8_21_14_all_36_13]|uniref:Cell wall biosynthesis glycosyltransferase n=1 Tax=Candidatus Campbellbacteria bacterium CG22_combo_CG10-13_8_21_14_all_36_13 TaxID=1974529 RepID=A0A2H0DZ66_9BACT|nr:MAG: cell wall biosynthesis glycosyltransferase [Candidatus Campbellbacteria bacterium CG22_combo_CG10-13_8_21_14_all_36_13]
MNKPIKKLSSVSFFCPAYYDEKNLPVLIPKVHELLSSITDIFEIIIVEDGSPDRTGEVADDLAKHYSYTRVIHHIKNRGYGGALKTGFLESKYDYVMYTDGDHQYDVFEFIPNLHLLDNADIISGYVTKKAVSFSRKFQSFCFNTLITILFLTYTKDINCSMKIYKRNVLDTIIIKSNSAFIDAEMILKAKKGGFVVSHFPVTHYIREQGLASGSKPSVIVHTIKDMFKYRFGVL